MQVVTNWFGGARRAKLNGRDYLVAPITMLISGVLEGSQGPLYYPPEEVRRNSASWTGVPITLGHPFENGRPSSAKKPGVVARVGLGFMNKVAVNKRGTLRGEGWFDVARTRRIAPRVLNAILGGRKIEVSTGLFTMNEPAEEGATFNGVPYTHIARNYVPDHLAILLDERGACSVQEGCGVYNGRGSTTMKGRTLVTACRGVRNDAASIQASLKSGQAAKRSSEAAALAAEVDLVKLAKFFGVETDVKADPVGWQQELLSYVDGVSARLAGVEPAEILEEAPPEEEPVVPKGGEPITATGNRRRPSDAEALRWLNRQVDMADRRRTEGRVANRRQTARDREEIAAMSYGLTGNAGFDAEDLDEVALMSAGLGR